MNDVLRLGAAALAAQIRRGERSALSVVDAHIERIEAVNGRLNAVVAERYAAARDAARAVDRGEVDGPLAGVPFTVKEFVAVRGMPHTGGVLARRDARAEVDAPAVARLRAAGAIPLGGTNAPEGGLWHETNNPLYGRTSNPWDTLRTPGGSSGGEAAILAAGGAPFGVGSDTGGSIRVPAAFCGVCGHKPTAGRVPVTGHYPLVPVADVAALVIGPMARRAADLPLLLQIMEGPDGADAGCVPMPPAEPVDVGRLRVLPLLTNGRSPVRPEVAAGVHRATAALAAGGARVVPLDVATDLPAFARAFELWAAMLSDAPVTLGDVVGGARLRDVLRPGGRGRHAGGVWVMVAIERLVQRIPREPERLRAEAAALRAALDALLGDDGVLVHPAYPRTAPRHRGMLLGRPWDIAYASAFNLTGHPATVVPVDVDPRGLPVGVQLVARRGRDDVALAAAIAVEAASGGWRGPVEPRAGRRWPWSTG